MAWRNDSTDSGRSESIALAIREELSKLVGLKLSIARRAADMRNFQFGSIRQVPNGTVGEFALHIQCPWRLEGPSGIVTGRHDLWIPADQNDEIDWDTWNYEDHENLQDRRLQELLEGLDEATGSTVNATDQLVVSDVEADNLGGAALRLTGGYVLRLFPAGSDGEDWRFFVPSDESPHFVIAGGKIQHRT